METDHRNVSENQCFLAVSFKTQSKRGLFYLEAPADVAGRLQGMHDERHAGWSVGGKSSWVDASHHEEAQRETGGGKSEA